MVTDNPRANYPHQSRGHEGLPDVKEVMYVDLSSVTAANGITTELEVTRFGDAPGRARRVIREGDVLVSTVRPYLRGFALVPQNLDGQVASTGFAVLRAKTDVADSGFIWSLVRTDAFVDHLTERATGSSYPAVRPSDVSDFPVLAPPLAEQERISDLITSVDRYIDSLLRQTTTARTLRDAVLGDLLFTGGQDWTRTTLGSVALVNPKEPALNADAPFVPMDAVRVGQRYVQYVASRGTRSGARAASGDVLFARITPCLENGKVAQVQGGIGRCGGSTEFIVIRGTDKISADFIYFWATSSTTRSYAIDLMNGTTGRQRLSANDLAAIPMLLPPLAEQRRIVELITSMDDVVQATERTVELANNVRGGLLSDLLSGEHEIPEAYNKLLEGA